VTTTLTAADSPASPAATGYQPSARRPIAGAFRRTARGAVSFCVRHGVHPDVISYLSVVASAIGAACLLLSQRHPWLLMVAPAFFYVRLWMNMLDGMVALAAGKASWRGEILNELPDRISDVLLFAAVAHSGWTRPAFGYWAAIGALMTAYVGMLGQAVGAKREFGGVMAKPIRMVMLHVGAWVTLALLWAHKGNARFLHLTAVDWTCLLVAVGCLQTVVVRLASTLGILAREAKGGATPVKPTTPSTPAILPGRRVSTECTFRAADGALLFYRAWLPPRPATRAILLFHRGHEHSGRWQETVDRLTEGEAGDETAIFAWDQRGHGRSPGVRGTAEHLGVVVKDADLFARHVATTHGVPLEHTIAVAHSVGAVIAAAWIHDYAPPVRGMVLATPAFRVKLYVPFAISAMRLKERLFPGGYVKSYVKSHMLTRDPEQAAAYDADPAIFRQISIRMLLDLFDTSTRLLSDAGAFTTPTLMLMAGRDWVVKRDAQWRFYERISSTVKQMEDFAGTGHAVFHDVERKQLVGRVRRFVDECFALPAAAPENNPLLHADRGGHTRTEYDRLRAPTNDPRWSMTCGFLRTIGRLSEGVSLGWRSGFDSGVTLDYVYANRPRGRWGLGWVIDRNYLNSIGWRGIRTRRENLQQLLRRSIEQQCQAGQRIHILDIACGAGRYVLETMRSLPPEARATALLRDYQQVNVDAARALAAELGLADAAQVTTGDAFDRGSLAGLDPKPTIAIVSGLYELFPENEPLRRSLAGLADAVEPGGYLIYTCQPWHPQVEFIARVLTNREGQPWVMRRRTQAEMDALVRAAGFEKMDQFIDRWGIFTVSLARRV
jgi:alpha-beta hydrolase superfamily lysophospholipase/phosphatidylglycerophosphate synthase/SAM-dependent methyltransferase